METTSDYYDWGGYPYDLGGQAAPRDGPPSAKLSINLRVAYPERSSRLLLFVKWAAAIPAGIVLLAYGSLVAVTTFISFWAVLFTGRYPK
ncbi:MAG: hypothetical protein ACREUU_12460, partial [Gammaproteobacteria bacterium]